MTFQFLNTLFVQTEGAYLSLDHETLKVKIDGKPKLSIPLHHLGSIVVMGRVNLSSPLLARCAADGRNVSYFDQKGEFLYRIEGPVSGNVLLRKAQFHLIQDEVFCNQLVRSLVAGKIYNSRHVLQRLYRSVKNSKQKDALKKTISQMQLDIKHLAEKDYSVSSSRGIEGINAKRYYEQFPLWIKPSDSFFHFQGRSRRPPRDPVNAVLSYLYRLLLNDCVGALQGVGLDPQVGFLHMIRPGRPALGLDLMEELRPLFADRLAISLINRRQLRKADFDVQSSGACYLNKQGRTLVTNEYQGKKKEEIDHPVLARKISFGALPHIQAQILARAIREDHIEYQPYLHGTRRNS